MKPRVYKAEAGCWHIQLTETPKPMSEPCFWSWWDAYHDALYIHSARKSRFLGAFYGGDA